MLPLLKYYMSRSIHQEYPEVQPPPSDDLFHAGNKGGGACTALTVWRKSLLLSCEGFTVIDSKGDLVYRVDIYARTRPDELILMDKDGKPILTMLHNKKFTLVDTWSIYEGTDIMDTEATKLPKRPIWYVKKNMKMNIFLCTNYNQSLAYVYRGPYDEKYAYVIKGSYGCRSCKMLDGPSNRVMAEIKRKDAKTKGVRFGLDVFDLVVSHGFDSGLAMALVLLLDRMFS